MVERDTINLSLTFHDGKKQNPIIIIQHQRLKFTRLCFQSKKCPVTFFNMCFWLKITTLLYLCLDMVFIWGNIGCLWLVIFTDTGKSTSRVTGDYRSPWKEELDTEKALFSGARPPTESGLSTKNLLMREWLSLSRMCQQKIQMKEFTRAGRRPVKLPAKQIGWMPHWKALILCPCWHHLNHKCSLGLCGSVSFSVAETAKLLKPAEGSTCLTSYGPQHLRAMRRRMRKLMRMMTVMTAMMMTDDDYATKMAFISLVLLSIFYLYVLIKQWGGKTPISNPEQSQNKRKRIYYHWNHMWRNWHSLLKPYQSLFLTTGAICLDTWKHLSLWRWVCT